MCGIAGIVGPAAHDPQALEAVRRMTDVLTPRGPDGSGQWAGEGVVLGNRRLAVVDLEGGDQPFIVGRGADEHALVYNGELYGAASVRRRLEAMGERFRTRCDTEVLFRSLLAHDDPERALELLTGMFAFAWWHPGRRALLLGRDRVGIKPLYYSPLPDGSLVFASSPAAIMASGIVPSVLDADEVAPFLAFGYSSAPRTLLSDVKELPPGFVLEWRDGVVRTRRWWVMEWRERFEGNESSAIDELDALLDTVVAEHLEADVPIAAFLSGGLDSSAIVARARRFDPSLRTLTVAFSHGEFDESGIAARTATHLGVAHQAVPMDALRVDVAACHLIVDQLGLPFGDSSALPTFLISRAAADLGKVVLSGDGGDELFAGYETFDWLRSINRLRHVPAPVRKAGLRLADATATVVPDSERLRQLRRALAYGSVDREERFLRLKATIDPDELARLVPVWHAGAPGFERLRSFLAHGVGLSDLRAFSRYLFEIDLPGDMLRKVDAMSMAASVEARVPLLDHRIVEFANRLPTKMKMRGSARKLILRRLMAGELPREVLAGRKRGFSIPLRHAMTPELLEYAEDTAGSPDSRVRPLVDSRTVLALVNAVRGGARTRSRSSDYTIAHTLWFILQLETWSRKYSVDLDPTLRPALSRETPG